MIIDAVITWVDGEDPRHIAKRSQIIDGHDTRASESASRALNSVNEIAYCVESILQYAPFIRTIFIVTDEQIPAIYHAHDDRIKVIDHKEIYRGYEQALPTINIFSIECLLYRIPGLAEHFIYFNDDFFLIKPTKPTDWFIGGLPVLRGRWETLPEKKWYKRIASWLGIRNDDRAGFRKTQSRSAQLVGFDHRYFRCYHTPRALRKTTFEEFFAAHPDLLIEQIKHRRRHASQFNPYSLAWHLEIKNKSAHIASSPGIMELHHPEQKSIRQVEHILQQARKNGDILWVNIQNMNLASPEQQYVIFHWLNEAIPAGVKYQPELKK